MDKYVVSFEHAKQLKIAGFPQDTVYKYYEVIVTGEVKLIAGEFKDLEIGGKQTRTFAAPLTDEIHKQLPDRINSLFVSLNIRTIGAAIFMPALVEESIDLEGREFRPNYGSVAFDIDKNRIRTLSNAMAELWMWCEEKGHLEIES